MARRLFSFSLQRLLRPVALISCLAGVALPAHAQFETRAATTLPQGADCIALGDFNNDGKLDLVVTDDNGFTVSLGNGDGTFQKPTFYRTSLSYYLAVGDFNNDGNLDIVVANLSPSTVDVYLGNGNGTFRAPISSNTTEGSYFVTVGDFNNDGKLDIAVVDPPYISVLLGNGNGTFQAPSDNNSFVGGIWLAVGDFNNDHNLDVISVGYFGASYDLGVLLGNGSGTLEDSITTPLEYVPGAVSTGDLNGDGKLDAVVGYDLDDIAVLMGNGDGTFQSAVNYYTTGIDGGQNIVGDLSQNGKMDVAVPSGLGVDVFWGNGDGTLQPAQFFASGESGQIAVGDLNGDGMPDFALATGGGFAPGAVTMLNTGVVSFSPTTAPLAYPAQVINTASPPQTLKLKNTGTDALSISSIKLTGPFQMSDTCGTSVKAGATCKISVEYKPKNPGTQSGLITIVDSASSQPQFIELTGAATVVEVSPTSLSFPTEEIGTRSAPQTVTATNEGSAAIQFSNVYIGGKGEKDFSATGNCTGTSIAPGASCEMSVTFDPMVGGSLSASLYFNLPTGSISPVPVALSGTGK
jgi:FG-GAP-like repeat/Protein of unknown function (DUF1573)